MKKISMIAILLIVVIMLTGCLESTGKKEEELISNDETNEALLNKEGYFDEFLYINEYMKFSFQFPESWEMQGKEQLDQIAEIGSELIAGDDKNMKEMLDASLETNVLFNVAAYKYPLGTPGKFNPAVLLYGENISLFPGIEDENDYYSLMKETMKTSDMEMTFEDLGEYTIDNQAFKMLGVNMIFGDLEIKQTYYITIIERVVLGITITSFDEASEKEMKELLNNFKFIK